MAEYAKNLAAVCIGLVISLFAAEGLSRLVMPLVAGAKLIGPDGREHRGGFVKPGSSYRQVSHEFDVLTTVTPEGYRGPAARPPGPDVIFLGDSFTFGQGLRDEETFSYLYCERLGLSCANLGVPGTGTVSQVDRLERFLEEHGWKPRQVFLFLMAMSTHLGMGNDLLDNIYEDERARSGAAGPKDPPTLLERLKIFLREHSNLARVVVLAMGPRMRAWLTPAYESQLTDRALEITGRELARLENLGRRHGFGLEVFLITPVQDIVRGTYECTREALQSVYGGPIVSVAPLFLDDPEAYYFPLDRHLNPRGSRAVAEFLIARATGRAPDGDPSTLPSHVAGIDGPMASAPAAAATNCPA